MKYINTYTKNNTNSTQIKTVREPTSVSCQNTSVEIPVYSISTRSFRHTLIKEMVCGSLAKNHKNISIKILDSVSFDVFHGDSVGILGHNDFG